MILIWPGYSRLSSISRAIWCESSVGRVVVDLGRLDHHAHLATGLHRVAALDAGLRGRDLLERLEPLDVVLHRLAAGARAGGRDRVGGLHEHGLDGLRLDVEVVRLDRVGDRVRLAVLARELARR